MNMTLLSDDVLDAALGAAAERLIKSLQKMPELKEPSVYVAIIGGYAVQHHVGTDRRTRVSALQNHIYFKLTRACILVQDVDVLLVRPGRPIDTQWIRRELVPRFPSFFVESGQPLFFKYTAEIWVQVDIIPEHLPPYLPAHAMALSKVTLDYLPFLDPLDLLAYKVHCASMRTCYDKQVQDAKDAGMLWRNMYGLAFVPLSPGQRQAIAEGIDLMPEYSDLCPRRKMRMRRWVNL